MVIEEEKLKSNLRSFYIGIFFDVLIL